MLTVSDFIHLTFTPDLTRAGIAYVAHSLARTYQPSTDLLYEKLRKNVTEIAVELAFKRYLVAHGVPHEMGRARPFTQPDRLNIFLGGRMCEVKSQLITHRRTISGLRKKPDILLQHSAEVPIDQLEADHLSSKDLLVFAIATGLVTKTKDDFERAAHLEQPSYCIHQLPEIWAQPTPWLSLGQLVLEANSPDPITLDLAGQGKARKVLNEQIHLPPNERKYTLANFYSLAFVHKDQISDARIGIHSPSLDQTHIIEKNDWGNIWVYGMEIILAGFITRGAFFNQSQPLYNHEQTSYTTLSRSNRPTLAISELRPLKDLFRSVKEWSKGN